MKQSNEVKIAAKPHNLKDAQILGLLKSEESYLEDSVGT